MQNRIEKAKSAALGESNPSLLNERLSQDVINFPSLWKMFKKKLWLVILLTLVGGAITGSIAGFLIEPEYTSSATVFLTPVTSESGAIDYNSINSNQKLVNNVMRLMTQQNILNEVSKDTGIMDQDELRSIIRISNEPNTELVTVSATTTDPKLSKSIVDSTVNHFITMMSSNLNVSNIEITEKPRLSYQPSGPSVKKYILVGSLSGFLISVIIIVILVLNDKRIKTREEAESFFGYPVYVELPKLD